MKHINLLLTALFVVASMGQTWANSSQGNWRWRNDDGSETAATWKAAEKTAITINDKLNIRLRVEINNSDPSFNLNFHQSLSYMKTGDTGYIPITTDASTNHFVLSPSTYFANLDVTTNQLSALAYPFQAGIMIESSTNDIIAININTSSELEYCIKATDNVEPNTQYTFRLNDNGSQLNSYGTVITLTTGDMGIPTYIKNPEEFKFSIYPNPTTNGFYVQTDVYSAQLTISDINGNSVLSQQVSNNEYVDVSSLANGVYIVELAGKQQKLVVR